MPSVDKETKALCSPRLMTRILPRILCLARKLASAAVLSVLWVSRGVAVFALARLAVIAVMPAEDDLNPSADYNIPVWFVMAWGFNVLYCRAWGRVWPEVVVPASVQPRIPTWWRLAWQGLALLPIAAAMQFLGKCILRTLVGKQLTNETVDWHYAFEWSPYLRWEEVWQMPTCHLVGWAAVSLWPLWWRLRRSRPEPKL